MLVFAELASQIGITTSKLADVSDFYMEAAKAMTITFQMNKHVKSPAEAPDFPIKALFSMESRLFCEEKMRSSTTKCILPVVFLKSLHLCSKFHKRWHWV
jgi:hypothetical protein